MRMYNGFFKMAIATSMLALSGFSKDLSKLKKKRKTIPTYLEGISLSDILGWPSDLVVDHLT